MEGRKECRERKGEGESVYLCVYVCMEGRESVCVCVCVYGWCDMEGRNVGR